MGGAAEEGEDWRGLPVRTPATLWAKGTIYSYSFSAVICCTETAALKKGELGLFG